MWRAARRSGGRVLGGPGTVRERRRRRHRLERAGRRRRTATVSRRSSSTRRSPARSGSPAATACSGSSTAAPVHGARRPPRRPFAQRRHRPAPARPCSPSPVPRDAAPLATARRWTATCRCRRAAIGALVHVQALDAQNVPAGHERPGSTAPTVACGGPGAEFAGGVVGAPVRRPRTARSRGCSPAAASCAAPTAAIRWTPVAVSAGARRAELPEPRPTVRLRSCGRRRREPARVCETAARRGRRSARALRMPPAGVTYSPSAEATFIWTAACGQSW